MKIKKYENFKNFEYKIGDYVQIKEKDWVFSFESSSSKILDIIGDTIEFEVIQKIPTIITSCYGYESNILRMLDSAEIEEFETKKELIKYNL